MATAEDTAQFSFAGMFESFLNVSGAEGVVDAVKKCWASTFGARVLYYRISQGMPGEMPVAVIVQRMVNSEKAGVMFTTDPATRARLVKEMRNVPSCIRLVILPALRWPCWFVCTVVSRVTVPPKLDTVDRPDAGPEPKMMVSFAPHVPPTAPLASASVCTEPAECCGSESWNPHSYESRPSCRTLPRRQQGPDRRFASSSTPRLM